MLVSNSTKRRFWAKVKKTKTCWLWTASCFKDGYGQLQMGNRPQMAHRVSWVIHNGKIPDGMCVLHNCPDGDNPRCVNPNHLWLGTIAENNMDKARKGRAVSGTKIHPELACRGERHGRSKLTWANVKEIRSLYKTGKWTQKDLAELFNNVDQTTISQIVRGEKWKE